MNVLKHPSFFRPASRPTSPTPTSAPLDRPAPARPLTRLSLSSFRRPSPSTTVPLNLTPAPLVQDGSYLELLNLKLSEAVSKALAQPTGPAAANEQLFGKRPLPPGRGQALGNLIASELKATQETPHLHRAIIRSLHRPLSVLLTNLSSHLLPLLSSPVFAPPPSIQSPNLNPTQVHALSIATFAGELIETFDELDLGTDVEPRGDGLRPIRDGLMSLINRVVGPLVNAIRNELMPLLEALETPNTSGGVRPAAGAKTSSAYHSSIVAMQAIMPIYAKAITRYTTSEVSQATLATFLISVVWRGLIALAHRPYVATSPPSSPGLAPATIKKSKGTTTPPMSPPAARFNIKLPPSRPPSPPALVVPATAAADARALFDLLSLFPLPVGNKESTRLAREVVDDAFEGLKGLPALLEAVHAVSVDLDSPERLDQVARHLEGLATEVPILIALPVILQAPLSGTTTHSVSELINIPADQYRKECLSGFGRAEECATTVARRVLQVLPMNPDIHPVVSRWLDMEIAEEQTP
ncbi:hypothetical protein H0H92_008865 [Tricholoma furcatifolium]|nr:hypothetical protein H0H92_008865 [Tricholoma furcatifolium]